MDKIYRLEVGGIHFIFAAASAEFTVALNDVVISSGLLKLNQFRNGAYFFCNKATRFSGFS